MERAGEDAGNTADQKIVMRHPDWIKVHWKDTHETKKILRSHGVSTVCEEARCPNQGRCFSKGVATFMILGDTCTRTCAFCAVRSGRPLPPANDEPDRVAEAARSLGLSHVVITSVTRDDLSDGGAVWFAETVTALKRAGRNITVEVLTPDFRGVDGSLRVVLDSSPDVFNHNVETVPRLYESVRPQADYRRSLNLLRSAKSLFPAIMTKSGIMIGLGETGAEIESVMVDLRDVGCDLLTIGQYLQPSKENIPVVEYIRPEVFNRYERMARNMGFRAVASAPLTRSSMDAGELFGYV